MAAEKGNRYAAKYSEEDINKICEDVINWAYTSPKIYISSYLFENYGKSKTWLHDLAKTYPQVVDALKIVKELIADKISNHCWEGDKNSVFGEKILPMYCDDYKKFLEWKSDLAKESKDMSQETVDQIRKDLSDGSFYKKLAQAEDGE